MLYTSRFVHDAGHHLETHSTAVSVPGSEPTPLRQRVLVLEGSQKSKCLLHTSIMKLYKRLLLLPPDCVSTDEEICVALEMPTPSELLRRTRLRYLGTLHRCEHMLSWRLLHQDAEWCRLVADDLLWLWQQIHHSTHLPDPSMALEPWRYLWRYHQPYWKGLIKRAFLHSGLQRQNALLIRTTFADFLNLMQERSRSYRFLRSLSTSRARLRRQRDMEACSAA